MDVLIISLGRHEKMVAPEAAKGFGQIRLNHIGYLEEIYSE